MNFPSSILLVDDEQHIRKYVGLILRQLGALQIFEAANGEEAVTTYERERPALVLLDINMPVMDGMETLKRLKALDADCVVVMLTSLTNRLNVEAALALGAVNYIRKDTPKEDITKALTETIESCFEPE
jgi:two-component system, chemotaxis family, chemotaxis protein CheY